MVVQYLISWFEYKAIRGEHILVYADRLALPLECSCLIAPVTRELSVEHSSVCEYSEGVATSQEAAEKEKSVNKIFKLKIFSRQFWLGKYF